MVDKYFTWTPSRIGGMGLAEIAREIEQQHAALFRPITLNGTPWKLRSVTTIAKTASCICSISNIHLLQKATRNNDYKTFKEYTRLIDDQSSAWRRCVG